MPNSMPRISVIASVAKQSPATPPRGDCIVILRQAAEDDMSGTEPEWSEADSRLYRELAAIAVPGRAEQIAALLALAPFAAGAPFRIVELGCGEGRLGLALLSFFPQARYLGLDGSDSMRQETGGGPRPLCRAARNPPFCLPAIGWLHPV